MRPMIDPQHREVARRVVAGLDVWAKDAPADAAFMSLEHEAVAALVEYVRQLEAAALPMALTWVDTASHARNNGYRLPAHTWSVSGTRITYEHLERAHACEFGPIDYGAQR